MSVLSRYRNAGHARWSAPDLSLLRTAGIQVLLVSRLFSKAGTVMLTYGSMVDLARSGGSQIEVSLISASGALAGFVFGMQGGVVADSMPKRLALGAGYAIQAGLCVATPLLFGTDVAPMVFLVFAVSLLSQVTIPALNAAVPLVATASQMATVTMLLGLVGGIGNSLGSAILAPVLVKSASINALCFVAGALFVFAAIRAVHLPSEQRSEASRLHERTGGFKLPSLGRFLAWMADHMAVATMILVAAAVQALSSVFDTLQPIFVRDVLEADPANAVYIFLPGAVGALIGTFAAPHLAHRFGLRWLAVASLLTFATAMAMFGLIDIVAPALGPLNPLRLVDQFGELGEELLAAGMIAILVKFATAATAIAVQTYINQRTPVEAQGSAFGMQAFISNAFGLTGILTVGVLATVFGSRFVFLVAPLLVAVALVLLIQASFRMANREAPSGHDAIFALVEEPRTETG